MVVTWWIVACLRNGKDSDVFILCVGYRGWKCVALTDGFISDAVIL